MTTENTIGKCSACGYTTGPEDPRIGTACVQKLEVQVKNKQTGAWDKQFVRCEGVITRHRAETKEN